MHQQNLISAQAEREMEILLEDGNLTNAVSMLNLSVLKKRFKCSDVFPIVETNLVRHQDKHDEKRSDLAEEIETMLSTTMSEDYTGNAHNSELVLLVRITVVSNGSRLFERLAHFAGTGYAKLTISYCLFSRQSGRVAIAKQLSHEESARNSDGVPEIHRLADGLRWKLNREVKFICCSRVRQWPVIAEILVSDSGDELL